MAADPILQYRALYAKLLRFYPKPFHERFGEPMEQTFSDLLHERQVKGSGLLAFSLWTVFETSAGIIKESIKVVSTFNRNVFRFALVTALLLMIPLVAMQFTDDVVWSVFDFIVAGVLLFGTGFMYALVTRKGGSTAYRVAVGMALVSGLMLIWVNLAVGLIGSEDNPANILYLGVFAVGFFGAILSRLRSRGMARTMFAMAIAQALVPVVAFSIWRPELDTGLAAVIGVNALFVMLFTGSGLLFRQASATEAP